MDRAFLRTKILTNHILQSSALEDPPITPNSCLSYSPPELKDQGVFDVKEMRKLLDGHNGKDRDWHFSLMMKIKLFNPRERSGRVFAIPYYNQSMKQQREMTMKLIEYLLERGVFKGWLTGEGYDIEMRKFTVFEAVGIFDHSIAIKLGVHFFLG